MTTQPAMAALLLTSAAVAAIAQPQDRRPFQRLLSRPSPVERASIRPMPRLDFGLAGDARAIRPAEPAMAAAGPPVTSRPAASRKALEAFVPVARFALPPSRPAVETAAAAPPPAMLAMPASKAEAPGARHEKAVGLAASRAAPADDMATAPRPVAADPIPMADDATWAALSRQGGAYIPDDARSDLKPGLGSAALATPTDNAAAPSPQPARERPVRMALDPLRGAVQDGLSSGIAQPTRTERGIAFTVPIEINRHAAGTIALRITTGDNISVRLMDILAALQPAMDPALHRALSVSKAAREYVTLNDLRAAGIAVSFASDDRLMVGTK